MIDYFNNKILILDSIFSKEECCELIDYYNGKGPTHFWRDTNPMTCDLDDQSIKTKVDKIEDAVNGLLKIKLSVDWAEIVEWPPGSFQPLHRDIISDITVFTSVTYLNDDYDGGRTYFENDIEVIPRVGRTLFFDGKFYPHGVTEIYTKNRYTLPIWYKITMN